MRGQRTKSAQPRRNQRSGSPPLSVAIFRSNTDGGRGGSVGLSLAGVASAMAVSSVVVD
jgi:hypothetical protein